MYFPLTLFPSMPISDSNEGHYDMEQSWISLNLHHFDLSIFQ